MSARVVALLGFGVPCLIVTAVLVVLGEWSTEAALHWKSENDALHSCVTRLHDWWRPIDLTGTARPVQGWQWERQVWKPDGSFDLEWEPMTPAEIEAMTRG